MQQNKNKSAQLYRRGFGLKDKVAGELEQEYSSRIVDFLKQNKNVMQVGRFRVHMAEEFGFCYGVDRAIEYAYQTRKQFPDKRIFLTGELIHNPHVNNKMVEMGIKFLSGKYAENVDGQQLTANDVVVLPAFGVAVDELQRYRGIGCILVDTTCGSVLNVWKRVQSYARDGFTSIIHGKWNHEETKATSSQTQNFSDSHFIVVLDMEEAELVCDYIAGKGDRAQLLKYFENAISTGFDPDIHLQRLGCANQTTMLSGESLAIAERIKQVMLAKYGEENLAEHFRSFDTICSATQDRQDAVVKMLQQHPIEIMLVIGGYNSSNTTHLVEISEKKTAAYHIDDADCLISTDAIRHKPVNSKEIHLSNDWLPEGDVIIGITAGASTPNVKIGEIVNRLAQLQDLSVEHIFEEMRAI
ncbi:MAG: 4-hydroxy-3-methylbut-2-enyl diphosphate reductase [Deferribacteres bacterium]|nr:4-hydroxy-3-methylbut-2-enyl diphosphate reductase [candidate division KSB1 bacterium]MCB9503419.1 4-hydroxy-3-methylbut-2-enyl diphosphate reductase [Deferribacteres bacterium]